MINQELEQLRQSLLEARVELLTLGEILRESAKTVELDQARVGRLSQMDAMQGQQMALEAARRHEQKILSIGAALQRMEVGEYGDCLVCGEEIDIRRLKVDPTNTRCINCAD